MANAFDSYLRAKQSAMQQGQQRMVMDQAIQKMQREKDLQGVLAGAYQQPQAAIPAQAAVPEMAASPAMGAMQPNAAPLADYPAQEGFEAQAAQPATAGGLNMRDALNAMYQGGFGKEALALEQKQRTLSGSTPSSINEYRFFEQLPEADKKKFMRLKRAQKYLDIGKGFVAPSQVSDAEAPAQIATRELKPTEELPYISRKAETAVTGKKLGEERALLADLEASLPNLQKVVGELSELGKTATYTRAGQMKDIAARQTGFEPSEGAIARKEYISKVDNEILPLLKQTFGAAFTEKEGAALRATLGDPDASPKEKDAVLRSFIDSKTSQIQTKQRRVGGQQQTPTTPSGTIKTIGGNSYVNINGKWYQQ